MTKQSDLILKINQLIQRLSITGKEFNSRKYECHGNLRSLVNCNASFLAGSKTIQGL
jgi:hypothetical protein